MQHRCKQTVLQRIFDQHKTGIGVILSISAVTEKARCGLWDREL